MNLIEETMEHFREGAKSVRAYTENTTYIITRGREDEFVVTTEEPGFPKEQTTSLEKYFSKVFGIEARY